jgi:SAM-dependent methyltransferase
LLTQVAKVDSLAERPLPPELSAADRRVLAALIAQTPKEGTALHQLWRAVDAVWDDMKLDNRRPDEQRLAQYYRHPVWLLKGVFTEADPESLGHRRAISDWLVDKLHHDQVSWALEFGGGFGTLARMIAAAGIAVDVLEPYPHALAVKRSWLFSALEFVRAPRPPYDALVAMDVLEHVPDPAALLVDLTRLVRRDGFLLFQNHFAPCIKCHLPGTFHLASTFDQLAALCGLTPVGRIDGSYASAYRKAAERVPSRLRLALFDAASRNVPRYRRLRRVVGELAQGVGVRGDRPKMNTVCVGRAAVRC